MPRRLSILLALALLGCGRDWLSRKDDSQEQPRREAPEEEKAPERDPGIPVTAVEDLPIGESPLSNLEQILTRLNARAYHAAGFTGQGLKVAILDNGFAGVKHSIGDRLPPNTIIHSAPGNAMAQTTHGTKLAEVVYAIATGRPRYVSNAPGPEIHLFNTNGYTNLVHAIDEVIRLGIHVVLYAQVWEYGGNGDGGGFINREVNRAIDAGVIWVNASGNLGQATWSGPIVLDDEGNVQLPYRLTSTSKESSVRFTVPQEGTPVKIVLAWNDFHDDKDYRTLQDLDLYLIDDKNQRVAASELVQDGLVIPGDATRSTHAREIIRATLPAGVYRLKVVARTRNFGPHSRLRMTVDGYGVRMLEKTTEETVLIPADNPRVVTVGALDVDFSGRSIVGKPEIMLESRLKFADGQTYVGTSAASAIAAGALTLLRSAAGPFAKHHLDAWLASGMLDPRLILPSPEVVSQ